MVREWMVGIQGCNNYIYVTAETAEEAEALAEEDTGGLVDDFARPCTVTWENNDDT